MTTIATGIKEKFEELPIELKDYIKEKDVTINNMADLMKVLEDITNESE